MKTAPIELMPLKYSAPRRLHPWPVRIMHWINAAIRILGNCFSRLAVQILRGYFFTTEVIDWMTEEAILKASSRSLMWCRRAIQSKSV